MKLFGVDINSGKFRIGSKWIWIRNLRQGMFRHLKRLQNIWLYFRKIKNIIEFSHYKYSREIQNLQLILEIKDNFLNKKYQTILGYRRKICSESFQNAGRIFKIGEYYFIAHNGREYYGILYRVATSGLQDRNFNRK